MQIGPRRPLFPTPHISHYSTFFDFLVFHGRIPCFSRPPFQLAKWYHFPLTVCWPHVSTQPLLPSKWLKQPPSRSLADLYLPLPTALSPGPTKICHTRCPGDPIIYSLYPAPWSPTVLHTGASFQYYGLLVPSPSPTSVRILKKTPLIPPMNLPRVGWIMPVHGTLSPYFLISLPSGSFPPRHYAPSTAPPF